MTLLDPSAVREQVERKKKPKPKTGLASLNGVPFRIDPTSIRWDIFLKTAEKKTLGGKVVQVLGVDISDIVVTGTFGDWKEQRHFLRRMKRLANRQIEGYVQTSGKSVDGAKAMAFLYPPHKWHFKVYLKDFKQEGSAHSVEHSNANFSPKYRLMLWVVEDHTTGHLRKVAKDAAIARLAKGMGWKQTKFNGPLGVKGIKKTLEGRNLQQYLEDLAGDGSS